MIIRAPVAATGWLFTVEENPRLCGWGAEVVSIAAEEAIYALDGPVVRITTPHVPLAATRKYLDRFPGEMPERRRYALAMLSAIDDGVGQILEALRQYGLEERTFIAYTSDNGAPLNLTQEDKQPVDLASAADAVAASLLTFVVYLVWIVWDGLRLTKKADQLEGYFLASRSIPWWAAGCSIFATMLSSITSMIHNGKAT